jgi:hypothetical protein
MVFFMKRLVCLVLVSLLLPGELSAGDEKLVIAHYMTDMVPETNRAPIRWVDPELADPNGSTAAVGGLHQTEPMAFLHLKNMDLAQAVDFEIRAARQMGVDGFQFYYPLVDNTATLAPRYNQIIRTFLRLSETRYPGFRVSLCLSHPASQKATSEVERIALWSPSIRSLVQETRDSPAWLRTDSGSLLFYLWVGDALADGVGNLAQTPEQIVKVGQAYQHLSRTIGTPIEYVYQVRRPVIDPAYISSVARTFSAVWGWTASEENIPFWDELAKRCRQEGCLYTQSVYPDYYTSKVYRKGSTNHAVLPNALALKIGLEGLERHYRVTNLAGTQIQLLKRAIKHDVQIINYITWNDFPEGHHLAPEVNHNFGPSLLLRYFKQQWKSPGSKLDQDQAVVFYKKYRHDLQPRHSVALQVKSENKDLASEDRIELVTLLREPASCYLNDKFLGVVREGLQIHSIPSQPGPVHVRVVRDGQQVIKFQAPTLISASPFRTDRLTYSYSSVFQQEFEKLFK